MNSPEPSGTDATIHELAAHSGVSVEPLKLRSVSSLSADEFTALEKLAFEYGQSPDAYLAVEADRSCFLSSDHTFAMSVVVSGRYHHIAGGILAAPKIRRQVIAQLGEYASRQNCLIACYSIGEEDRLLFEEAGWEVTKFGEDTTLRLETLNWTGKDFEWVRRQANACQRAGLTCREIATDAMTGESWDRMKAEIIEILREDLRERVYAQELNLLVGKLDLDHLGRRRVFIVENKTQDRVEAFVVANPMRGGTGWALEMFRKRAESPRGVVPFLIKWIIDTLKTEGVEEVSLSILLWKGSQTFKGQQSSTLLRWGLLLGYHLGDFFYHTKGMAHFKTRFRPELTNCYVCVTPKTTVFSILNFFRVVGAFSWSSRNVVRNLWRLVTRRKTR